MQAVLRLTLVYSSRFTDALSIGATINNIGGNMVYTGQYLRVQTGVPGSVIGAPNGTYEVVAEEFQIPSYFQLGLAYQHLFNEQNQLNRGGHSQLIILLMMHLISV